MSSELITPFLGALQASVSVILTILYGVAASQFALLNTESATQLSKLCVQLLLPALLITNLGDELHLLTATRYIPILVWAIIYNCLSLAIAFAVRRVFNLPRWIIPATTFNNTTSFPLLLIQSLTNAGALSSLLVAGDHPSSASNRARSYFLVSSVVGNTLTFGFGKDRLGAQSEDLRDLPASNVEEQDDREASDDETDERSPLLPISVVQRSKEVWRSEVHKLWNSFPSSMQKILGLISYILSPPAVGAMIGAIIGLVPALHRAFMNPSTEGGYFNAWFITSLKNVGELFVSLQIIVVGVKLAQSMRRMKRGERSGRLPWGSVVFVLLMRFVFWPVVSIVVVWLLASKTTLLGDDPILWFTLMLLPVGPSAMKLLAMAEVDEAGNQEKMAISKFLIISYALAPILSVPVLASLKASEAVLNKN